MNMISPKWSQQKFIQFFIVPTVPPPPPPQKKKKRFGLLPAPWSGYATTIIMFFFAHLLILEYPYHHQI